MTHFSIRRIQIVCFALSHIPLVAIVALLASDGIQGDVFIMGVAFLATLITAVSLTVYLGRSLRDAGFSNAQGA